MILESILSDLSKFPCVDLHYERDYRAEVHTGEVTGEWDITICLGRCQIRRTAGPLGLLDALKSAHEEAVAAQDSAHQAKEEKRKAALAKLTDEERRLLGL